MFSRPVSSGWKPVPTSKSEPTRPFTSTSPSVGAVMRERIFKSVDFPAPLRPMMPTTSPRLTSKETSFRAQNVSGEAGSGKREVEVRSNCELRIADGETEEPEVGSNCELRIADGETEEAEVGGPRAGVR